MRRVLSSSVRRMLFTFAPLLMLIVAAEAVVRVKYFLTYDYNWNYLAAPFEIVPVWHADHRNYVAPAAAAAAAPATFAWHRPCEDHQVYSEQFGRMMPYTYDEECLRGDRVSRANGAHDYRIFVLGDSSVESPSPDEETMTTQLKRALPSTFQGRAIKVVNAGRSGYAAAESWAQYDSQLRPFHPDLVAYYGAMAEQAHLGERRVVDDTIRRLVTGTFLQWLHYKSMLWTYLVEKYTFAATPESTYWKVDTEPVGVALNRLRDAVTAAGGRFVYVTQVADFPRYHRDVDTFDYEQVNRLLDALKRDPAYHYDPVEISYLNQRLVVDYAVDVCRRDGIPVIDLRHDIERLGEAQRHALFVDRVHFTWKLDRIIGEAIAAEMTANFLSDARTKPAR